MHFPRALPSSTSSDLAAGPSGPATLDRHLLDYLAILIRRRWLALAALGAALALAGLHLYTSTPLYEATAQLLIEHENRDQFSLEQSVAADRETTDYYNTQYTILQSRSLARKTPSAPSLRLTSASSAMVTGQTSGHWV